MLNRTQMFKIAVAIILGILGFCVGMIFLGILLMEIFGINDNLMWAGGLIGSIISIIIGFKIFISAPEDKPAIKHQHKQAK